MWRAAAWKDTLGHVSSTVMLTAPEDQGHLAGVHATEAGINSGPPATTFEDMT
jgi:hypothetical protein